MSQPPPPPPPGMPGGPPGGPPPGPQYHQQPTQVSGPSVPPQGTPPQGPGYGYPAPGQPQFGYQPTPPGGTGGGNRTTGIVIAVVSAVVALCVLGVGLVWIFSDDDGGGHDVADDTGGTSQGPSGPQAQQLFALRSPSVSDVAGVPGAWATDTVFAKSTVAGVLGVDPATGKQKWKLALGGDICAASRQMTDEHLTAVVAEGGGSCSRLVVFDLDTGEKSWQKTMPGSESASIGMDVTIGGGTVAANWIGGSAAYRIDGEGVWSDDGSHDCSDRGYAGGAKLVAVVECSGRDGVAVQTVDPVTGDGGPVFQVPGDDGVHVVSTDPLVLVAGEKTVLTVRDGDLLGRIDLGERYEVNCEYGLPESCYNVVADDGAVYLKAAGHDSEQGYRDTNEIVAFDLTGKKLWSSPAGDGRTMLPLVMADGEVVAYRLPGADDGGQLLTLDPATGRSHVEFTLPDGEAADSFVAFDLMSRALYADGRFYLQQSLIAEEGDPYLAVGFGVK